MTTPNEDQLREIALRLTKAAMDRGQLIEAGWIGLRMTAIPPDAPEIQINEMRMAFFSGAMHVFSSIMAALDPDAEPTEDDMRRMSMIHSELEEHLRQFKQKHGLT